MHCWYKKKLGYIYQPPGGPENLLDHLIISSYDILEPQSDIINEHYICHHDTRTSFILMGGQDQFVRGVGPSFMSDRSPDTS